VEPVLLKMPPQAGNGTNDYLKAIRTDRHIFDYNVIALDDSKTARPAVLAIFDGLVHFQPNGDGLIASRQGSHREWPDHGSTGLQSS
jgi:hypothetical protein